MQNLGFSKGYPVTDNVEINLHILGALVLDRVGGEIHFTDIVAIHKSSSARRAM